MAPVGKSGPLATLYQQVHWCLVGHDYLSMVHCPRGGHPSRVGVSPSSCHPDHTMARSDCSALANLALGHRAMDVVLRRLPFWGQRGRSLWKGGWPWSVSNWTCHSMSLFVAFPNIVGSNKYEARTYAHARILKLPSSMSLVSSLWTASD